MRILQVVGGLNRGGAETWLVQVLRHLDRDRYKFDFLVHSNEHYAYEDEVVSLGSRVIRCLSPGNLYRYAINFRRVLKDYGPYDCVHSHVHDFSGIVLALAALSRVPTRVAQSHSDTRSAYAKAGAPRRLYIRLMRRLIARYATTGTAVSEMAGDCLFPLNWKSSENWRVDPLGIDLEAFGGDVDRSQVRRSLGIPEGALVIGHVGRFQEVKNHTFLVDIAEKFIEMQPNAVFLFIGDGPLKPAIEAKVAAKRLDRSVLFLGVRTDVAKIMKGAMDALVFPSLYEGLGLVVLEAQAAGLSCLVSDTIPAEAHVPGGLVQFKSLQSPPAEWAQELVKCTTKIQGDTEPLLATRSLSVSLQHLCSLYEEGMAATC